MRAPSMPQTPQPWPAWKLQSASPSSFFYHPEKRAPQKSMPAEEIRVLLLLGPCPQQLLVL